MKKQILSLGKVLGKGEQKEINGGFFGAACKGFGETGQSCSAHSDCLGAGNPVCFKGCCNTAV